MLFFINFKVEKTFRNTSVCVDSNHATKTNPKTLFLPFIVWNRAKLGFSKAWNRASGSHFQVAN